MSDVGAVLLIAYIVGYLWFAILVADVGECRGLSYWGVMCASLAFSPLGALAIVLLISKGEKSARRSYQIRKTPYISDR